MSFLSDTNYLDTTQSATKDSFAKKYSRWYNMWSNRFDSTGKTNLVANKMLSYLSQTSEYDLICSDGGEWILNGPLKNTVTGKQNLGIVVTAYTPNANSDTIYIGSNSGGIWKTENANDSFPSWECLTTDPRKPAMGVSSIVVDPNNPLVMYAATGNHTNPPSIFYGMGILKSTDGGITWNSTGLTWDPNSNQPYEMITLIKIHPTNSNIIYAAGSNVAAKLYKSTDAGNTWSTLFTNWGIDKIYDIEFAIGHPDTMFISDGDNRVWDHAGIYRSFDGGNNWTEITPPYQSERYEMATTAARPGYIYTAFGASANIVLSSSDWGSTWQSEFVESSPPWDQKLGYWKNEFVINQLNPNIMYFGGISTFKYNDSTGVRSQLSDSYFGASYPNTHGDIRDLQILSSSYNGANDILLIATDGGTSKSYNGGASWKDLNGNGPSITQFYDLSVSSYKKNYFAGGAQDNSTYFYDNNSWKNHFEGDGGQTIISWANPSRAFLRMNERLFTTSDFGALFSYSYITNIGKMSDQFVDCIMQQNSIDSNVIYASKGMDFKRIQKTGSFSFSQSMFPNLMLSTGLTDSSGAYYFISDFNVSESDTNIIYAALREHKDTLNYKTHYQLLRSLDAGLNWDTITSLPIFNYFNISEICVHPENPGELWIGINGYNGLMYHSTDSGKSWTDFSNGLPPFPINTIVQQKDADKNGLYCGTDVGVFRYNASDSVWECFNNGIPVCIVTDLEINYCENRIYAATFGRGIWSSPLQALINPKEITANKTIPTNSTLHAANNITVKAPYTLTVNGTLNMGKGSNILIEPGAKLYVNGGTITNLCGETWDGIIVDGQAGLGQAPSMQGSLILTNATIEHAKEAVRVHDGLNHIERGGGIVEAENTLFRNNWRSVEYSSYHQFNPLDTAEELNNRGRFNNCTFVIDSNMRDFNGSVPFRGHVSMWDVHGVKFGGCTFENRYPTFAKAEDAGYGILTIDAQFFLYHLCSGGGCPSYDSTVFYRLYDGVRVSNSGTSTYSPVIDRCLFKDCHYGVFNDKVNFLEIARSKFEVGGFPKKRVGTSNIHEGVSIDEAYGFIVTENQFENSGSNPTNATRIGTRSSDLGRVYNVFYNNRLNSIQFGNLANGTNAMSGSPFLGLNYACNTHSSNWSDITAYGGTTSDREVIALRQGSPTAPAGNEFSTALIYNINNYDSLYQSRVTYYYYQDSTNEEPVLRRNVVAFSTSNQIGCQSQLPDSSTTAGNPVSGMLSTAEYNALLSGFANASDDYETELNNINGLIDNGDTPYWLDQVINANSSSSSSIANDLRGFSPWVSESILRAMIDNSEFDVAEIMLVLEDNPDVLRTISFMNYLRESDRFDASEIAALYVAMENLTGRTESESEAAYLNGLKHNYAYRIIRNHLNDTSGIKLDSIHAWLQAIPSLETTYTRVELLRQANDWAESGKVLDSIPSLYNLTDSQTVAFNDYKTLHELLYRIDTAGIAYQSIDSSDYAALLSLAQKGYSRASIQAQSILNYAFGHNFRRPALLPEEIEARPLMIEAKDPISQKGQVWVQPNPASQFAIIGYNMPEGKTEAILKVVDAYGRLLLVLPVNADKNNVMFNVAHWSTGTYYLYLEGNGWKSKANTFVVNN